MERHEYIKKMESKLMDGDIISNEDVMRGILMILRGGNDDVPCDINKIAMDFYETHQYDRDRNISKDAQQLRNELTYVQYTEVMSIISQSDGLSKNIVVGAMKNI